MLPIVSNPDGMETICGYSFRPHDIDAAARQPGISAFMRIRNGEEFVESTIRSHVDCLDEIVAVYHDTSDATPAILMRLAGEYGPKLRVIHYLDTVAPLASREHVRLPADAPGSFINVSNFAFAATTRRHFMLLDDDHLAWDDAFATLCAGVRRGEMQDDRMWCISAFNLMRGPGSQLGVPSTDPFAGNGDHGLRAVRPGDFFEKDNRFERFVRNGRRREFKGFAYWHMKYLKRDAFANHDRERDPANRYNRKRRSFEEQARPLSFAEVWRQERANLPRQAISALFDDGHRLRLRRTLLARDFVGEDVRAVFQRTVAGRWSGLCDRANPRDALSEVETDAQS